MYNHTYRQGKGQSALCFNISMDRIPNWPFRPSASQYTYENVCIVPGGRAGLSRVAAVIGDVYTVSISV